MSVIVYKKINGGIKSEMVNSAGFNEKVQAQNGWFVTPEKALEYTEPEKTPKLEPVIIKSENQPKKAGRPRKFFQKEPVNDNQE